MASDTHVSFASTALLLLSLAFLRGAAAQPNRTLTPTLQPNVAPVLPPRYHLPIRLFASGNRDEPPQWTATGGRLLYDYPRQRQVSVHPHYCISRDHNETCRILMVNNHTLWVQSAAGRQGRCCRFPDGDVPLPAPDAYSYWPFVGQAYEWGYNGSTLHLCNQFEIYHFQWFVDVETGQPLRFRFGGGDAFDWAGPVEDYLPRDAEEAFQYPKGCEENVCDFCWFPPGPNCPYDEGVAHGGNDADATAPRAHHRRSRPRPRPGVGNRDAYLAAFFPAP